MPISKNALVTAMLQRGDLTEMTEDELRSYFARIQPSENDNPFRPKFEEHQAIQSEETVALGRGVMDWANELIRNSRNREYARKIKSGKNYWRIVCEGDSWFHYPFGYDVIYHLKENMAIKTWAAAGAELNDMLRDPVANREFIADLTRERPHAFLFSGGGNDLLGEDANGNRNIMKMVEQYDPHVPMHQLLSREFYETTTRIYDKYMQLMDFFYRQNQMRHKSFVHGYAYAVPGAGGGWLRAPLQQMGYNTPSVQNEIVRVIVDTWNDKLKLIEDEHPGNVYHVNCRIIDQRRRDWYDEIHPKGKEFARLALQFQNAIVNAWSPVAAV